MSTTNVLESRLRKLREAFDQSFALPFESASQVQRLTALCCRVGAMHYALPISDLSGVFKARNIVPVPARARGLIGVGIFRSVMIPVYDLSAWLGVEQPPHAIGWIVQLGHTDIFGVRVDAIDGYSAFAGSQPPPNGAVEGARYFRGSVEHAGQSYALVDVQTLHRDVTKTNPSRR